MSIPHSKVLSVSKGFGIGAEFRNNSPSSTQVVNVNVAPSANDSKDSSTSINYPPVEQNPYNNLTGEGSSNQDVKEVERDERDAMLKYKDNVIEALSALLSIVENNPLIVNKLIVANLQDLAQLIKLLTGGDSVQINTNNDIECSCLGGDDFVAVEKIYVIKGDETLNFKYSFPDANKILDDHHVSVKLVKV